ncbi:MAG: hypothetical protein ACRDQZ_17875 [Mycobacteriales bacterium]
MVDGQRGTPARSFDADAGPFYPGRGGTFLAVDGNASDYRRQAAAKDNRGGRLAFKDFFFEDDFVDADRAVRLFDRCTKGAAFARSLAGAVAEVGVSLVAGVVDIEQFGAGGRRPDERARKHD